MMFFELSIDYGLFIDLTAEDDYINYLTFHPFVVAEGKTISSDLK